MINIQMKGKNLNTDGINSCYDKPCEPMIILIFEIEYSIYHAEQYKNYRGIHMTIPQGGLRNHWYLLSEYLLERISCEQEPRYYC